MAENPNDKALREKLLSAEYAYDPGAWAAMEQLMDQKKRRGFLWWWLSSGAVAVALLVSAGAYYYYARQMKSSHLASAKNALHNQVASVPATEPAAPIQSATEKASILSGNTSDNNSTVSSSEILSTDETTVHRNGTGKRILASSASQQLAAGKAYPGQVKLIAYSLTKAPKTDSTGGASSEATFTSFSKSSRHNKKGHIQKTTAGITFSDPSVTSDSSTKAQRSLLYVDDYSVNGLLLDSEKPENILENNGEDVAAIPAKHKHRISISYSLGMEAGVYTSYTRKTFSDIPTWSMGLAQQINIGKYLAITNSILYSEVNFKVNHPVYPINPYSELKEYHSHIKELVIPVGIKIYPYTSHHLRFGIGLSYVNHVKTDEKFVYKLTPTNVYIPSSTADFPEHNSFDPGTPINGVTSPYTSSTNKTLMEYYSLGNGRRYYGSVMYTIGFDILLPHHISISVEPAMRMSIGKIKMQDSRVFDFGMNAGVKYTF